MTAFQKAHETYRMVCASPHSSFYRNFYKGGNPADPTFPASVAEWKQIPPVSKEDIIRVPWKERLYLPEDEIDAIRITSGTTGKGVLILPRLWPRQSTVVRYWGEKVMTFYYHSYMHSMLHGPGQEHQQNIAGDPTRLDESAELAARFGADALHGTAAQFVSFAPYLQTYMPLTAIRFLNVAMERASVLQQQELLRLYPAAACTYGYGMQEAGMLAFTYDLKKPFTMQVLDDYYVEIDPAPEDAEGTGELLVTSSVPEAFPLVRYRTGDVVKLERQGERTYIDIIGRVNERSIRIPGGEIFIAEIERVVGQVWGGKALEFECVVLEKYVGGSLQTGVELVCYVQDATTTEPEGKNSADTVAHLLRVNAQRTYADGVAKGLYAPLTCLIKSYASLNASKVRRMRDARP